MGRLERTLMEIAVSLVFIILAAVFFGIHEKKTEDKPEQEPAMKREADREMRGVWVASVENLDYPAVPTVSAEELRAQADAVLDGADKSGFNAVFLQVRPCSDALYPSEIYPWSRYLTGQQGVAPDSDLTRWRTGSAKPTGGGWSCMRGLTPTGLHGMLPSGRIWQKGRRQGSARTGWCSMERDTISTRGFRRCASL